MMLGSLRGWCKAMGVLSGGVGSMLLPLSVWWMLVGDSTGEAIIGGAGMITAAILCWSGLVTLTVLAVTAPRVEARGALYDLE